MPGIRRCVLMMGLLLFGATVAQAQTAATLKTTQGVYTAEQASRGEKVQMEVCSMCHSPKEDFTREGFIKAWQGRSVKDLFHNLRETMPEDMPGSLTRQQYADVIAYILQLNGMPAGSSELKTDDETLSRILIERKKP